MDETWESLQVGIERLEAKIEGETSVAFTSKEYMALYTSVYDVCSHRVTGDTASGDIYARVKSRCADYVSSRVVPAIASKSGDDMLKEVAKRWQAHRNMATWYVKTFGYIDSYYTSRKRLEGVKAVTMRAFHERVYGMSGLRENIVRSAAMLLDRHRSGDTGVDLDVIRAAQGFFVDMEVFGGNYGDECFEPLLEQTERYYASESSQWVQTSSCLQYMSRAEAALTAERARAQSAFPGDFPTRRGDQRPWEIIVASTERKLLADHGPAVIDKELDGCVALLRKEDFDSLKRMVSLFSRVEGGIAPIARAFRDHVREAGRALFSAEQARDTVVGEVVKLHVKYEGVVRSLDYNATISKALKEAFESFCGGSAGQCTFAELLANYCDAAIRAGSGWEEATDCAVDILAFTMDKDVFAEFYKKKLARRLILERGGASNDDVERAIIAKLKRAYGNSFTAHLDGMVNDIVSSNGIADAFQSFGDASSVDFSVTVITMGMWPKYHAPPITLPPPMAAGIEKFGTFYSKQSNSKKLTWVFSLGTAVLSLTFPNGKKHDVEVIPFQAAALLLFSEADTVTWGEARDGTGLPDADITRTLASLSCGRFKILVKTGVAGAVGTTDSFSMNPEFSEKRKRFKVPFAQVEDKKRVLEDVHANRTHAIDAAIVRLMKSRKAMQHQELVREVLVQMQHFQPDAKGVKRQIETLIAKEYIERDPLEVGTYRYLA